ncbi:hypothetical protein [Microbacterium sp. H1-D42]|uniref:hypothetical protein n=1 Tax=Microbacterium sp. H1-D42 TaxID=2925844 RepID=UPI001F5393A3|nr:hypothetical protein [Microbacterium sp. H1-D42]UNK70686.1 hypothetical protein MNR00_16260 [Microbacterium sp. H1-D42]
MEPGIDAATAETQAATTSTAEPSAEPSAEKSATWPSLLVGIVASAVMLFPSWVGGGRLPLQNLWQTQTMPDDMPFSLLPVSQYYALNIFGMLLMGGIVAGLAVRVLSRRRPMRAGIAALGVLLVHAIVTVQSFAVVADGLGLTRGTAGGREVLYFGGMLGGVIMGILFAQLGLLLTSRRTVTPVALGIVLAAVPFASWIGTAIVAFTTYMGYPPVVSEVLRWLPAVIVGVTLAWCGVRPLSRLAVWIVGPLAVWVLPAVFTAMQYVLGSRVLLGDLREMADAATQIFPQALAVLWQPAVVALVIGLLGTGVRMLLSRRAD